MNITKETVKAMELFVKHRATRIAYYAGVGAAYMFAAAAILKAIRWW
ncbi:hypothetical protein N5K27_22400 [Pigmentiphaga sp. GD03639]|nr:hypothetical protein [Pigmentiphaga sp. GD03639]MDH2239063.1 hypothetical protein [Pigmentiphaga sp. GD03639]